MKGFSKSCRTGAVVLGVVICVLASASRGDVIPLTNGVPVSGISERAANPRFYAIVVPEGQDELVISIGGGSGDCDLYVRRGAIPTTSVYDHWPWKVGNDESVTIAPPEAGTWYIMLWGYEDYSGLTLQATYSCGGTAVALTNGVPIPGLSGAIDSERVYQITVPAGRSELEISIAGGTGDCDLYVRRDAAPTTALYDYRPFLSGNNELVIIEDPAAGTWYIMLKGCRAYTDVTLLAAASRTAYASVAIAGHGDLRINWVPHIYPADICIDTGLWPAVTVEGPLGEADTRDSEHTMYWSTVDYATNPRTTITANFDVSLDLFAGNPGDAASAEYWIRLELFGIYGTVIDFDEVRVEPVEIADGAGYADVMAVSLSVTTPPQIVDTVNNSQLYLRAYAKAEAFTAAAPDERDADGAIALTHGTLRGGLAGEVGSVKYYKIDVPAKQSRLEIATSGGAGDVDLYVRKGLKPTATQWDYRPHRIGNDETVVIPNPTAGTYFIMLRGNEAYSNACLMAVLGDTK
ncbi:PPC domain-containing protein [Anaerobaca lacustris]|uniref:PPC domain-containing protein n=1 Tax=Anaerobaca lacustris TaxID=3044600 RepID=A0AAW6U1T5_9BACT|nr:PPC domain-containing protein [Sedimentisphaerales bacterium M17dextr]